MSSSPVFCWLVIEVMYLCLPEALVCLDLIEPHSFVAEALGSSPVYISFLCRCQPRTKTPAQDWHNMLLVFGDGTSAFIAC